MTTNDGDGIFPSEICFSYVSECDLSLMSHPRDRAFSTVFVWLFGVLLLVLFIAAVFCIGDDDDGVGSSGIPSWVPTVGENSREISFIWSRCSCWKRVSIIEGVSMANKSS